MEDDDQGQRDRRHTCREQDGAPGCALHSLPWRTRSRFRTCPCRSRLATGDATARRVARRIGGGEPTRDRNAARSGRHRTRIRRRCRRRLVHLAAGWRRIAHRTCARSVRVPRGPGAEMVPPGSDRRRGLRLQPRLGHTRFGRSAGPRSVPHRARGLGRGAPSPQRATRLDPRPAPARAVASGAGILALPAARARHSRCGRARRLAPPRGDVRARLARPLRALPPARHRVPPRRDRSHHHDRDLPGGRQCPRGGTRRSATLWRERPQRHRLAGRDRGRVGAPWSRTGPTATQAVHVRDGGRGPSDEPIARFDRCGRRRARYLRRPDRERTSRRRAKPRSRRSDSVDFDARRRPRGGYGAATSEPTNVLGVRREHNDGPRGVCRRWSRGLQGKPSVRGRLATRACGDRFSYGDRRAPEAIRR